MDKFEYQKFVFDEEIFYLNQHLAIMFKGTHKCLKYTKEIVGSILYGILFHSVNFIVAYNMKLNLQFW